MRRWPEWLGAIEGLGPELWALFGAPSRCGAAGARRKAGRAPRVAADRMARHPAARTGAVPRRQAAAWRGLRDRQCAEPGALAAARGLIAKIGPPTLAVVINPTGDLPGTEKEGAIVASHFAPEFARAAGATKAATPDAVLAALKGKTHWHFASHGAFSWADARQSSLIMHGGAP